MTTLAHSAHHCTLTDGTHGIALATGLGAYAVARDDGTTTLLPPCDVTLCGSTDAPQTLWDAVVHQVAARAKSSMGTDSHSRIDKAVQIVLTGGVHLNDDHSAVVASQREPLKGYAVNGACPCKDFANAPASYCKHRLAVAIHRRALEMIRAIDAPVSPCRPLDAVVTTPPPAIKSSEMSAQMSTLPEAPASVNVRVMIHGRECQITLRDMDEGRLLQRLSAVLAQYPLPEASATPEKPAKTPTKAQDPGGIYCALHGVSMKRQSNARGEWWSHKQGEGWCKGK